MKSEFDKGYAAGRFQAYQDARMILNGRIDRIEPGKDKKVMEALESARHVVLHHLRSRLDPREFPAAWHISKPCQYPDCVDNGPDGKCTYWLVGACPGPQDSASTPEFLPPKMHMGSAPSELKTDDKDMWIAGWNDCRDYVIEANKK